MVREGRHSSCTLFTAQVVLLNRPKGHGKARASGDEAAVTKRSVVRITENKLVTIVISVGRTGEIEDIFLLLFQYHFMGLRVAELLEIFTSFFFVFSLILKCSN